MFKLYAEFRVRNQETPDKIEHVYKGFKGATLALASCILLLLLPLLFCCCFAAGEALLEMSYIRSSGGTCYENLFLLDETCQVQIFPV